MRNVAVVSSKMNSAERSPRAAPAMQNCSATVDFPLPAGPRSSVLLPGGKPPPTSLSSAGTPLGNGASLNDE